MANELKHGTVGTELTQAEWEGIGTHVFSSQATGDLAYASSATQLSRLGISGTATHILSISGGVPVWAAPASAAAGSLTGATLASGVTASSLTSLGTIATGTWQGTDVGVAYGGTGVSTLASNSVLTGTGASAITAESNLIFDGSNLDLNNQGSIINVGASGNDWTQNALTLAGGSASQTLTVETTGGSDVANLTLKTPASSTGYASIEFTQGSGSGAANNMRYIMAYDGPNGQFDLRSTDINGSSGDGDVFSVADGTDDVQFLGGIGVGAAAPTSGIAMTGDIAATGARVSHIYTTSQTTTNAETVDSWSQSKENIFAYTERALDIIRDVDVITFSHLTDRDPSGRIKLGVRAESINEPLTLVHRDYGYDLGTGPALDTMGLAALNVKAIQELEAEVERLRGLVEA
jgi:hypothetical protein